MIYLLHDLIHNLIKPFRWNAILYFITLLTKKQKIKMETTAKLYSLNYSNVKTYLFALLFVAGNIVLPQLCHLIPAGGPTLLPIYFFTLIASYKYGFRVGLLTAVLSPVINHLLFAMLLSFRFFLLNPYYLPDRLRWRLVMQRKFHCRPFLWRYLLIKL